MKTNKKLMTARNDGQPARQHIGALASELARRVRSLCPDHRDPHRFHEEKSEIAHELHTLAQRIE